SAAAATRFSTWRGNDSRRATAAAEMPSVTDGPRADQRKADVCLNPARMDRTETSRHLLPGAETSARVPPLMRNSSNFQSVGMPIVGQFGFVQFRPLRGGAYLPVRRTDERGSRKR